MLYQTCFVHLKNVHLLLVATDFHGIFFPYYESQWLPVGSVKSTWKPYLSKSTDTLKLLHYKSQVTNTKTTWVKVLEFLIWTVLKCFTYTKYKLKDALVKETSQSNCNAVEKLGKTGRGKDLCAGISAKNYNKTTGKQTTITFNNSQRTKATLGLYILYIYRRLTSWTR